MERVFVDGMWQFKFDMLQAAALGAVMYYFGIWMRSKIPALEKYSMPAPVIGGLVVAAITATLHARGIAGFSFDSTLQMVFMTCFFCTVGLNASYKLLIKGGIMVFAFWGVCTIIAIIQNAVAILI